MKFVSKVLGILPGAAALVAAAVVGGGGVAQATPAPAGHVTPHAGVFKPITNQGDTTKCLSATMGAAGAAVIEQTCDPTNSLQNWKFENLGGTTYRFVNQSGFCLFAFSPPAANGKPMGLNTCRTVSNEQFNTHSTLPGFVTLESESGFTNTGFCVDIPGVDGGQAILFRCSSSNSFELWGIPPQN